MVAVSGAVPWPTCAVSDRGPDGTRQEDVVVELGEGHVAVASVIAPVIAGAVVPGAPIAGALVAGALVAGPLVAGALVFAPVSGLRLVATAGDEADQDRQPPSIRIASLLRAKHRARQTLGAKALEASSLAKAVPGPE